MVEIVTHSGTKSPSKIAVVIPSYRVKAHLLALLEQIGPEVSSIYVVDDHCPEKSGLHVLKYCQDKRVQVIQHDQNTGVGGAMVTGYMAALQNGDDIVVKLDGDGQMNPHLIPEFVRPIQEGRADYTKGNRFFTIDALTKMPLIRIIGNAILSFVNKVASGYWDIMDPTNGYTAVSSSVLQHLPLNKLDKRYFFESDMLFRLNTIRAVIHEIPMNAIYGNEKSNLRIGRTALTFPWKYLNRFFKRIFYNYFLRDFNACSIQLILGLALIIAGSCFGVYSWITAAQAGVEAPTGTVMLAVLPIIIGFQMLMAAVNFDVTNIPRKPLSFQLRPVSIEEDSSIGSETPATKVSNM